MNKISTSALALAAVILVAPITQAYADSTPGWYVGAGAGGTLTPDAKAHTSAGDTKIAFDPGWNLQGSGGYAWSYGLRVEGEIAYSHANVGKVYGPSSTNGHLSNTDFFANALYDFHTGTMLTPYLGVGVGLALADADHIGVLANGRTYSDSEPEFAYQGIAGLAMQLDDNWAVSADYRYIGTTDPKFAYVSNGSSRTENSSHNVVLGVRYSFGSPEPVAPMHSTAVPQTKSMAPTAKPVVAPVPESYMVFFDFNKADLTPEAKRILASAAQEYKRGGVVRIVVTGHTDTVGSIPYNQKLSERRAAAVKAELASLGVDAKVVKAVGAGKNGLLVPTADGVREAQNRRAEIVFEKK